MTFRLVHGGQPELAHRGCEAPPYEPECAPCNPCNPCEPKCPPKTRAADAIIISETKLNGASL